MNYNDLPGFYKKLDESYNVVNGELESATYTNVDTNFVFSSDFARHRWFNYKEGFSPILVEKIFEEYGVDKDSIVCDPFCGAGTTLTVAQKHGIDSIGFEVNPFAAFITKVKTNVYTEKDIEELDKLVDELKRKKINPNYQFIDNEYMCRVFDEDMLQCQLNIRKYILDNQGSKAGELLKFSWLCTLEECSLYRKAGNGLKKKKNPPTYGEKGAREYALEKIVDKVNSIKVDYDPRDNGQMPLLYIDSATTISERIERESLDLVLFSPPYANCFDYTKIYIIELWFGDFIHSTEGQKEIRMKSIRSHCHATWPSRYDNFHLSELNDEILPLLRQQKLWTNRIPDMLNGYFADMEETLKQIYATLKKGGHCSIVVSNSAYAGIIIPTDIFLAKISERIGFRVEEIEVKRLIITSSQQYKKTEHIRQYLRESIVKLEK